MFITIITTPVPDGDNGDDDNSFPRCCKRELNSGLRAGIRKVLWKTLLKSKANCAGRHSLRGYMGGVYSKEKLISS